MAWSVSTLKCLHRPLIDALAAAALRTLASHQDPPTCEPPCLAKMAWAFSSLRMRNAPLFDAISASSIPLIQETKSSDLVKTAWALSSRVCRLPPLRDSIASSAIRRLGQPAGPGLCHDLSSEDSEELAAGNEAATAFVELDMSGDEAESNFAPGDAAEMASRAFSFNPHAPEFTPGLNASAVEFIPGRGVHQDITAS